MTDDKKYHIENGKRLTLSIDGHNVTAGFNVILGHASVAYVPPTSYRPPDGSDFPVDGEKFKVKKVRQSTIIPHMIVVELDPVETT